MALTAKQQRFVEEYLVDLNATQAAIRSGYSEKTARSVGSENLTKPDVAAAIAAAQQARSERTGITADRVLKELAVLGFSDMGDYIRIMPNGQAVFDWSALPEDGTKAISEITQEVLEQAGDEDSGVLQVKKTKFKLYDKRAALVDIGKHLGMFTERHEHTGKDGGPIQTEDVSARDAIASRIAGIASRNGAGEHYPKPNGSAS